MAELTSARFRHKGQWYQAHFTKRPFREGLEVAVNTPKGMLRISELGLGRRASIVKLKLALDNYLKSQ